MTETVERLAEQVAALDRVLGSVPGAESVEAAVAGAPDATLLELVRIARDGALLFEAVLTRAAGEVASRSASADEASLARRLGERNAVQVVAKEAHLGLREAAALVGVGEQTAPRLSLVGEVLEPERPHVATALDEGVLSVELAALISATLTKVAHLLSPARVLDLEATLVRMATAEEWSVADFTIYCRRLPNVIDPDGAEPREEDLRAQAGVKEIRRRNGMLRVIVDLHPEVEEYWRAAMDAKTAPRRFRMGIAGDPTEEDPLTEDHRSTAQRRLDALAIILRRSLEQDDGKVGGTAVTMLVGIDMRDLVSGLGTATIAGVEHPISAKTARRLAVQAGLIPQVLGGRSVLLDQGAERRLFTQQQRYALATRDGGCVWPGCQAPPGWCEVHHLERWEHIERTDLNNGVLLCPFHHHRLDADDWEVFLRDGTPYLRPPAWLDPARRARRGGRPRPERFGAA